jgi:hypothetical protein
MAFWPRVLLVRKPALAAGFVFLLLCLPVFAQETSSGDSLASLVSGQLQVPALSLANAQPFSFPSTLGWIDLAAADFLPALPAAAAPRTSAAAPRVPDSSKEVVDVMARNFLDSVHGEVGVLYGHSIGKFDRDVEAGYILGEVGDDKLQISLGAFYEHSSGRVPRLGR